MMNVGRSSGYQPPFHFFLQVLLHCWIWAVQCQSPTIITLPEALTSSSGNVVEGSVIQIYCTVENNINISFTWTRNGMTLLNDPPHIRIRTNTDDGDTNSVLTVDNFRVTDNDVYLCTATDTKTMEAGNGTAVTLTAVDSTPDGTLMIVSSPSDNEPVNFAAVVNDNRTGIALGGTVDGSLMTCIAGHHGDGLMDYALPSVVWVRNGQPVDDTDTRITITPTTITNGRLNSSLTINDFELSDAGVYQCIFTDSDGTDEIITTVPYRLDTGNSIVIERISPAVIILRPPEKLVIAMRVTGEYEVPFWIKNENFYSAPGFPVMFPQEFPNFAEIFVRDNTTDDDLGIYRVRPTLSTANAQTHTILPGPNGVDFAVILPEDANTTALTTETVIIFEGGSADISCRSVGAPAPSITWELNNQIVSFEQTETVTQFEATLTGTIQQRDVNVTPGIIISELHIVSARYPDYDGVYTCVGTNSDDLTIASSSANITVEVQVIPEVEITAFTKVNFEEHVTITCSVIRGNPIVYTYSIVHIDTMTTSSGPTRMLIGIQMSDLGTYRCDVTNDAGTGSANITIEIGVPPNVSAVQPDPVVVDTTVDLVCIVTAGDLPIDIVWESESGAVFMGNDTTGGNTTIMIGDGDYGMYTCTGSNRLGMDSASIEITRAVAPVITILSPEQQTITSPNDAVYTCQATARPRPSITWYRVDSNDNRTALSDSDKYGIREVTVDSREQQLTSFLTVSNTRPSDTAVFVCEAPNVVRTTEQNVSLTVHVRPDLTVPFTNFVVNETYPVTFVCLATGVPAPTILWYRGNKLLNGTDSRVTINDTEFGMPVGDVASVGSSLTIDGTLGSDTGTYRCEASNNLINGNAMENGIDEENITLFVQVPPDVVPLAPDQRVTGNESMSATLSFRIDNAAPTVNTSNIRWFYSPSLQPLNLFAEGHFFLEITNLMNRMIASASILTFSSNFLELTINNIVQTRPGNPETDTGRYFFEATNEAGVDSSYIDLIVFGEPAIFNPPMDQFIMNNGSWTNAVFTCGAQAFPEHDTQWEFTNFNGTIETIISTTMATRSSKYSINSERNNSRFGELTVMNVEFEDRGVYTCSATNSVGTVVASANLTVHVVPMVVQSSGLTELNINNPAVLVCLDTGYPIPTISWWKNDEQVTIYNDNTYSARLNIIEFAPEFMPRDANMTKGSSFQSSGYEGSGSILGLLSMYTDTTVDEILALGELGVASLLYFEETVREDTANYTCVATNALPQTTTLMDTSNNIPLVILERPDPPGNVKAFNSGARWVALCWTPTFDGNKPVITFNLYVSSVDVSNNFTLIGSQTANDLLTSGGWFIYNISEVDVILPFTNYSFTVVSCNVIGCSDRSGPSPVIETDQDRPDTPPIIVDTFSPSSTSLYLSWTSPPVDLHRGILIGYQILYRKLEVLGSNEMMTTTADTSITLEGLGKFSNYRVSVSAGTIIGYGPQDMTTFRTLNDTSSPPVNITGILNPTASDTIRVTWLEPNMPNGIITHYNVVYSGSKSYDTSFSHEDSFLLTINELGSSPGFEATLTNLFPGTVYTMTVFAINSAGEGERESIQVETMTDPPVIPSMPPSANPPELGQDPRTIIINVPTFSIANGRISHYQIVVVFLPFGTNVNELNAPDIQFNSRASLHESSFACASQSTGVFAYITAEISSDLYDGLNGKFVVGQDENDNPSSPNDKPAQFINGPLCYSTRYTFFVRAYTGLSTPAVGRRAVRQTKSPRQYSQFASSAYTDSAYTVARTLLIQLRLKGVDRCQSWVVDNGRQKLNTINASLVNNVEERCQCGFSSNNIMSSILRCFEESEDSVTYRTEITGAPVASTEQIASFTKEWLAGSALITFEFVAIQVDSSCQVVVSSIADPECTTPTSMTTQLITHTTSSPPTEQSGAITAIVGGTFGIIVTVLVVIPIAIVVIIFVARAKKTRAYDPRSASPGIELDDIVVNRGGQEAEYEDLDLFREDFSQKTDTYENVHLSPSPPAAPPPDGSPTHPPPAEYVYDYVQQQLPSGKEFDYIQCAAYVTTVRQEATSETANYYNVGVPPTVVIEPSVQDGSTT